MKTGRKEKEKEPISYAHYEYKKYGFSITIEQKRKCFSQWIKYYKEFTTSIILKPANP